ncbi:MAG: polysaccharide biosynthesis/export family protein [Bacteroidales bacterium]|nr:polysaccharide biosynthesis/export family protein [Bacteroidales bacterium]
MRRCLYILFLIFFTISYSSCYRNMRYIVDDKTELPKVYHDSLTDYYVRPGDRLDVRMLTTNKDLDELFSREQKNQVQVQAGNGMSNQNQGNGFEVSDSGYVLLPIFGNYFAQGKTINKIRTELQELADQKFIDAIVSVNFLSFDVYFVGYSTSTKVTFNKTQVNLLEALAEGGTIPATNNKRRNVMIIRKVEGGRLLYRVDLTDRSLLEKPEFYLKPGDIINVEPRRIVAFREGRNDFLVILSTFTTALSTYYIIKSL